MGWGEALTALGAAGEGAIEAYSWGQDQKFKKADLQTKNRAIDSREQIAQLNAEIRQMLESMKEGGRNERHDTASGSVVAQQDGANGRTASTNATRQAIADMNTDVRTNEETGRNDRFAQGITSKGILARMQDATRRYGIDTGATTTRRGQDINQELGQDRIDVTERGQNLGAATAAGRIGATLRGQDMRGAGGGMTGLPPLEAPAPTTAPAAPASDPGRAALAQAIRAAVAAVQSAQDPASKAKALETLKQLRAQVK